MYEIIEGGILVWAQLRGLWPRGGFCLPKLQMLGDFAQTKALAGLGLPGDTSQLPLSHEGVWGHVGSWVRLLFWVWDNTATISRHNLECGTTTCGLPCHLECGTMPFGLPSHLGGGQLGLPATTPSRVWPKLTSGSAHYFGCGTHWVLAVPSTLGVAHSEAHPEPPS